MGRKNSWELLQSTKRAALFTKIEEGCRTYVVSIGNGKKQPPDHEVFRRDKNGNLIVEGSYWRYVARPGINQDEVRLGAEKLYLTNC